MNARALTFLSVLGFGLFVLGGDGRAGDPVPTPAWTVFQSGEVALASQVNDNFLILEQRLDALEQVMTPENLALLADLLPHLSIEELDDGQGGLAKTVRLTGVNLQIVNGLGATNGNPALPEEPASGVATNGLGNLIVGYNELRVDALDPDDRTGSHCLVVGRGLDYSGFGGIVAGEENRVAGAYASVTGGFGNRALDRASAVSGGLGNTAGDAQSGSGTFAWVGGGEANAASGSKSAVTGGTQNAATDQWAAVAGGFQNTASGNYASVAGGEANTASETGATVAGGELNLAGEGRSHVCGGLMNETSGLHAVVVGGEANEAFGTTTAILGGRANFAGEQSSAIGGGELNTIQFSGSSSFSTISGGCSEEIGPNSLCQVNPL